MQGNIFNKQGFGIPVIIKDGEDFLSLTAMCKDCGYEPKDAIRNFLSNKDNLKFIITRQIIEDPSYLTRFSDAVNTGVGRSTDSNYDERVRGGEMAPPNYDVIMRYVDIIIDCIVREYGRMRARTLINKYDLTCLHVKKGGRDSGQGIYAHHDIALRFAEWLNPAYGVFVNKDYQRLKNREIDELTNRGATWKFDRRDAALWHRLLEVAVRSNIVPKALDIPIEDLVTIPDDQLQSMANEIIAGTMIYVSNLINVAVFGKTAKQWRDENPELTGNIRDYATEDELNLVSYLEYQMIQIVAEEPQSHWRKLINRISKKCRDVGIATMLNMSTNTGIITTNDPVSYDARTITAHESAKEAFKNELLTGKIHYDKNDDVFRDIDGFIRLGWKI